MSNNNKIKKIHHIPEMISLEMAINKYGFKLLSADPEVALYSASFGDTELFYVQEGHHLIYAYRIRLKGEYRRENE